MKQVKITAEHDCMRLDRFIQEVVLTDTSRSHIQGLIKSGHVLVNGNVVKTGYSLKIDDEISIEQVEPKPLDLTPVDMHLDVVYEDDDLLIINKPSGMVVHPASSYHQPTLVHGLLHDIDRLSSINGVIRPGIVHRIDKDTSGLLVVAKNDKAHQTLSDALKDHDIKRRYLAIVYHPFKEVSGKIDVPIARNPKNRLKMAVLEGGKTAVTHFKVLLNFDQYALISCELETGRTHQIRVHMAYIGHPIIGDPLYGPKTVIGDQGQYLHAIELSFQHPIKKEHMTFKVDMPKSFIKFIQQFKPDFVWSHF